MIIISPEKLCTFGCTRKVPNSGTARSRLCGFLIHHGLKEVLFSVLKANSPTCASVKQDYHISFWSMWCSELHYEQHGMELHLCLHAECEGVQESEKKGCMHSGDVDRWCDFYKGKCQFSFTESFMSDISIGQSPGLKL